MSSLAPGTPPALARMSRPWRDTFTNALFYLGLSAVGLTMVLPFLWSVSTSLKAEEQVHEYPFRWVPSHEVTELDLENGQVLRVRVLRHLDETVRVKVAEGERRGEVLDVPAGRLRGFREVDLHPENYPKAWTAYPFVSFWRAYANSLGVALLVTLGQVLTSSLAAYAFARLVFPGRDLLFFGYLATMMVPGAVTMIPTFVLLKAMPEVANAIFGTDYFSREFILGGRVLGIDSYFALIVPRLFSAYGTFMLRQFFLGIPKSLEEAARIDGCGTFGIYRHIVMPLSKPALATLTIFTFMWAWGDFLWPLIVVNTDEIKPLPLLLASFQGQYAAQTHLLVAASLTVLAPMLFVFVLGQRYFIEGIKLGGVKG